MSEQKKSHKQIWKPILIFSSAFFGYGMLSLFLYQRFGSDAYAIGRFLYAAVCLILYLFSMPEPLLKQGSWKAVPIWTAVFLAVFYFCYLIVITDVPGSLAALFQEDMHAVFRVVLLAGAAGIFEETMVRGYAADVIYRWTSKCRYPVLLAGVLTSLLFGLLHLSNLHGDNAAQVWIQVFYACMIGLALYSLRMISGSIALPVITHILIDLQPGLGDGVTASAPFLLYAEIFLPLGVFSLCYLFLLEDAANR
ncbi:MAG: lysostaphin resistance A-like protein [Bulleidia sp.]